VSESDPPPHPDDSTRGAISAPGELIRERYRVEKILGRGGMGEVVLAQDTLLHRRVALKRLRSDGAESDARRRAILQEARRAIQVSDPRIAAIYDVLELERDVLIVMEYVDGTTLRTRTGSPVPLPEFWDLAKQSVAAVGVAHARGIVHRDIKPENLMLTGDGRIKILDFGIARRSDAPEGAPAPAGTLTATTMTAEGQGMVIAGTPQYMAPEAHYGGRIDARTDIFSLGTVFYELLAAENPFAAPGYQQVLERVMTRVPRPLDEVNSSVSPALAGVIAKMVAKNPAERQGSCEDVLRELEAARGAAAAPAPEPARSRPSSLPRVAAALGLLAVAAAMVWGMLYWAPARALPADRNLLVLAPATPGAREEFAAFALGAVDLLARRLQKHQVEPGFQTGVFVQGLSEHVTTASDAHKILGTNLALIPVFEPRTDVFHARLELWNGSRNRVIGTRVVETPIAEPLRFLDRLYRESAALLGLSAAREDPASVYGVRGAGTLRFLLQGIGRMRTATTAAETEKAVEDLELARRAEPEAASVLGWLAAAQRQCFAQGNDPQWLDKADASAREATMLDSSRAEGFRILGIVLLLKKDPDGALSALARAVSLNPTDDDACSRLGATYRRVGQPEAEVATYRAEIARRPHCWQPYWWLANTYVRRGPVDEAIQAYRQMVRHSPEFYRGYSNLGGMLVLRGDYAAAIDSLRGSLELRPTKEAFDNLGTAYFNSNRIQEAVDSYNQAFQFGLAGYDTWLNLGDAYFFLHNRRDRAAEAYGQAVRLGRETIATRAQQGNSFDVMIPANLATVFPKLGQPDSARVYLKRALAADSANTTVQYCAALTYWQLSERDQALRWLDKSVQAGFPTAWLKDSPVFREWKGEERFRAILTRAAARSPSPTSPN
jgi:tetratricopeptide (TPR) repeat protein/tRNA A-37 threonylcarbamoyl transferase component Bud32